MTKKRKLLEEWYKEEAAEFEGWNFSRLDKYMQQEPLPWDYREIVQKHLHPEYMMLDMGTGGGEFLLTLGHPYINTCVTEAYPPNVRLCTENLVPLGITLKQTTEDDRIPFCDEVFDIVLNRHESFDAKEVNRVLKPNGIFITQQVGEENNRNLSKSLIDDFEPPFIHHNLKSNQLLLEDAGLKVKQSDEYFPRLRFFNVRSVVYFAKVITWEFPGFSVKRCTKTLLKMQRVIEKHGYIESLEHRFYLVCEKSPQKVQGNTISKK